MEHRSVACFLWFIGPADNIPLFNDRARCDPGLSALSFIFFRSLIMAFPLGYHQNQANTETFPSDVISEVSAFHCWGEGYFSSLALLFVWRWCLSKSLLRKSFHLFVRHSILQVASTGLPNVADGTCFTSCYSRNRYLPSWLRATSVLSGLDCRLLDYRSEYLQPNMCFIYPLHWWTFGACKFCYPASVTFSDALEMDERFIRSWHMMYQYSWRTVFLVVDFVSCEDLFWNGVVIVAFVILLASCYQSSCAYFGFDLWPTSRWSFYSRHHYRQWRV
jgi:hypothetical protein